jgi:hypothetical protein
MINPSTVFVRGMRLEGYGFNALKKPPPRNGKDGDTLQPALYHESGSGTLEDPTVAYLQDQDELGVKYEIRQAVSRIARSVAKANGFQCVLIRKGVHPRECTYDKYGRRNTFTTDDGRTLPDMTPSDDHITVWMGESPGRILVGGHIYTHYVIDGKNPWGKRIPQLMDDPANQRTPSLVQPGRGMVAEEFWLVRGTWERRRG